MKGKKIIVSALVASMVAAPATMLASESVKADTIITNENEGLTVLGPNLKVTNNYTKAAKKGDEVTIPTVVATGAKTEVNVYDPLGNAVNYEAGKFTATKTGVYTFEVVAYEVNGEDEQTSIATRYTLTCTVTGDTGSIEMPNNSYFVVPAEYTKTTENALTVPVPGAYVNDEAVSFDTAQTVDGVTIKAFLTTAGKTIELNYNAKTGEKAEEQAHFTLSNEDKANLTVGNYKLTYKLVKGADTIAVSNSKSVLVKTNLTSSDLYISLAGTFKSSAEIGVEYNLVDVNASFTENSTNYVDAYTEIVVKHTETGTEMKVDYENLTFVPTLKGDYTVTYTAKIPSLGLTSKSLTRTITNVQDTTIPLIYLTGDYSIDPETGNAFVGEGDDKVVLTGLEIEDVYKEIGNRSSYLSTYYALQPVDGETYKAVTVKIPAVYVTDNYKQTHKDLTITRNLYKKGYINDSGKLTLLKSENVTYGYNEVAEFKFSNEDGYAYGAGEYVVRYEATDASGKTATRDFNIVVKDELEGVPTLTFKYDEEIVNYDETITFDAPTATDVNRSNSSYTDMDVRVYATVTAPDTVNTENNDFTDESAFTLLTKDEEGKYSVKVEDFATTGKLYLVAVAKNNYDNTLTLNKNFIVKTLTVLGTTTDGVAPETILTYTVAELNSAIIEVNGYQTTDNTADNYIAGLNDNGYVTGTKGLFDQTNINGADKNLVKIPEFKFKDADNMVDFEAIVTYETDGKVVTLNTLETGFTVESEKDGDDYVYTISGASFRVRYHKTYTVTVVAKDASGNANILSFAVRVNDTVPADIYVPNASKFSEDIEVGTEFTIPKPEVKDEGEVVDAKWSYEITNNSGKVVVSRNASESINRKFVATETGTYFIKYTAYDDSNMPSYSNTYSFNVVATEKPVITLQGVIENNNIAWDYSATTQNEVVLPRASANEAKLNNAIEQDKITVTVKNSKGDAVTVNTADDKYTFVPTTQGTYTITYTAQGKYLTNTETFTINVGDSDAPTLDWAKKSEDLVTTAKVNDTWTFKFNMVNLEDNEDDLKAIINGYLDEGLTASTMTKISEYMTITMSDPDNKTVAYTIADGGLKYTFNEAGNYTFKITLKDKAGNSTNDTYSYTIKVESTGNSEDNEKHVSNAVGTVLIVLSVVILAGVVAYFVITTKQADAKTSKEKETKKNNKKDK